MQPTTSVFIKKEGHWNSIQNRTDITLVEQNKPIAKRIVKRLFSYAKGQMENCGFPISLFNSCEIYTLDGEQKVTDRWYTVRFMNSSGYGLELSGILINENFTPIVNHGIEFTTG